MGVSGGERDGASEGIRTLDINLGKVALYQTELRSLPDRLVKVTGTFCNCKSPFPRNRPAHRVVVENLFEPVSDCGILLKLRRFARHSGRPLDLHRKANP